MKKLSAKRAAIYIFLFAVLFAAFSVVIVPEKNKEASLKVTASVGNSDTFQLFYTLSEDEDFQEQFSVMSNIEATGDYEEITMTFPNEAVKLRLDLGGIEKNPVSIKSIEIVRGNEREELYSEDIIDVFNSGGTNINQIASINETEDGTAAVESDGNDPFIILPMDKFVQINNTAYFAVAFMLAVLLTAIIYKYVYLRDVYDMAKSVWVDRRLLISLAVNDFKVKYAGSYFGIIWAFVQPICTILIFWFVFQIGLRSGPVSDLPFVLWLIGGLIPWFFFSDAWSSATNAFMEYSYLVKKVVFKIDILPLVKILSALFVHLFFVVFMMVVYGFYGYYPTPRMFGLVYYMFCMIPLAVGLSFITASVVVFFKDLSQMMSIFLQVLMWITPIMWNIDQLPLTPAMVEAFKLNPMFYIVQGYRNCMSGAASIIPDFRMTVYFWLVSIIIFFIGISLFRRLKVHFADVL